MDIFREAVDKLVDRSCDAQTIEALRKCALDVAGVQSVDLLRTRVFASRVYVDIEIGVESSLPLLAAHDIARNVHFALERGVPGIKHVMVHINPHGQPFLEER